MATQLAKTVRRKLELRFPTAVTVVEEDDSSLIAEFSPVYPDFGTVVVEEYLEDEVIVHLGRFAHAHIGCNERDLEQQEVASRIADDVCTFLDQLFSDRIECYGNLKSGGWNKTGERTRSWTTSKKSYFVWSGPVDDDN